MVGEVIDLRGFLEGWAMEFGAIYIGCWGGDPKKWGTRADDVVQ